MTSKARSPRNYDIMLEKHAHSRGLRPGWRARIALARDVAAASNTEATKARKEKAYGFAILPWHQRSRD